MAEHSFDIGGEFGANGTPPVNTLVQEVPHEAEDAFVSVETGEPLPLPRLDPARGVFVASNRNELRLSDKPISSLVIERLSQQGKPKIPMVEVTLVGGRKQIEAHPGHEGYKALLAEWEQESRIRILKYLLTIGVKESPPEEFIADYRAFFPDANDLDMKYLYVSTLLPDEDIDAISEAIMSRTMPTTKGLEESADSFRNKS